MVKRITGYEGGESEGQLLAALKQAVAAEEDDAWTKIRDKYMYIGSIISIAQARDYIKKSRLGFAGYVVTYVGYAETTCRDCLKCWSLRRDFDRVREWVQTNNNFKPAKLTGPTLFLDSHKAWSNRMKTDAAPTRPAKKPSAKELRQLVQAYRSMLDRVGDEYVKQAEINQFEPRVWHSIVQERAAIEAELSETSSDTSPLPVMATRPADEEEDDAGQHPDTVTVTQDEDAALEDEGAGQHPGTVPQPKEPNFAVVEPVVPPKRTPRPTKPVLALAPPVAEEPDTDAIDLLKSLAASQKLPVEPVEPIVVDEPVVEKPKTRRGWPKGKARGPRRPKREAAGE